MKINKKTLVQLSEKDSNAISMALVSYANAAYPSNGSECSQASNQTLKQIALNLGNSHLQPVEIKKRQLPMIKAALRWYYSPESPHIAETEQVDSEKLINTLTRQ